MRDERKHLKWLLFMMVLVLLFSTSILSQDNPVTEATEEPVAESTEVVTEEPLTTPTEETVIIPTATEEIVVTDEIVIIPEATEEVVVTDEPIIIPEATEEPTSEPTEEVIIIPAVEPTAAVAIPPLPGGRESPLRVMVPQSSGVNGVQGLSMQSLIERNQFPSLIPELSFSPGPKMNLPLNGPASPFNMLAVLVDFSDNASQVTATSFDSLIFGPSNSVAHYYDEVSYGQLDIVGVTLPSSMGWIRAPQSYSYYVNGQNCTGGYPNNCQKLAEDLAYAINGVVDFSKYDNDNNGWVDTFMIIHAGSGAEFGTPNAIWSHSWWTKNPPLVDGKYVGSYIVQPEFWENPGDMTIGVYAHELAHAFGLPDFYDTDYSSRGIGTWGLMGGGSWNGTLGNSPAHLSAYSRAFLGFNTPINITGDPPDPYNLPNVEQNSSGSIFRWDTGKAGEYFLIENRQPIGYDAGLSASGMLIWHVDENVTGSNRYECKNLNNWNCTQHFRLALEQADGNLNLENNIGSDGGDPFPGTSNKTSFGHTTSPNTSSYYSATDHGLLITNISSSQSTMTFNAGINLPDAATLISPTNTATVYTQTPTFVWSKVTDAEWYNLRVKKSGVEVINQWYEGSVVCSTNCSATHATALTSGTHTWEIQTYSTVGYGAISSSSTFYIPMPGLVTLSTPTATINVEKPTYTWSKNSAAQWYHLYVAGPEGVKIDQWFDATVVCSTSCSVTPNVALLHGNTYTWYVQTYGYGTMGPWTSGKTFTVNLSTVGIPSLLSPADAATLYTQNPAFSWSEVNTASWYNLHVTKGGIVVIDQWFDALSVCSSGTCSVVPNTALSSGVHTWKMQAYNAAGRGAYSSTRNFTIPAPTTLGHVGPVGVIATDNPSYTWYDDGVAQWYHLYIAGPGGVILDKWYDVSTLGCSKTCTVSPNIPLTHNVTYTWYTQAWAYGTTSSWSSGTQFTVSIPGVGIPTLISPSNSVTLYDDTPTFVWSDISGATWYNLYVEKSGAVIVDTWYQDGTICNGATCSIDPGKVLTSGVHTWKVRAYNQSGYGTYSTPRNFTIPTPGTAVLQLPSGTATTTLPDFWWNNDPNAQWYRLYVHIPSSGVVVIDKWYDSATLGCGDGSCIINPGVGLTSGQSYRWYVQTYGYGTLGPWSNPMNFNVAVSPPNATSLISPTGTQTATNQITYKWYDIDNTSHYRLQVTNAAGSVVYHDAWYYWGDYCVALGECTVYDAQKLPNGDYKWKIQTYGPGGYGPWTSYSNFSVLVTKPLPPTQIAPWGVTQDNTPTFSWYHQTNSLWYWVDFENSTGNIFGGQWYYAPNVCNTTTCSIPAPVTFANDSYIWWIQSYNNAGLSSDWNTYPFTVAYDGFVQTFDHWYEGGQWWDEIGWYDPHNPTIGINPNSWYQGDGWAYSPGATSTWKTMGFDQSNYNYNPYFSSTITYSDFYYESRMWRNGCNSCANSLFVRGTIEPIEGNGRWDSTYILSYDRSGYFSIYTHDQNGAEAVVQPWTYTSAIAVGSAWNRVGVWANGDWLYFYINNTLVASVYNDVYSVGNVGFGFWSPVVTDNYLYVDYAVLYDYSGGGAPERQTVLSASQAELNLNARRLSDGADSAGMRVVDETGQRPLELPNTAPPAGPNMSSPSASRSVQDVHARPD